jgi:hypothetical protein
MSIKVNLLVFVTLACFGQQPGAKNARIPNKLIEAMVKAQLKQRRAGDRADIAVKAADGWCRAHGMVLLPAKDGIAADCGQDPKQDLGRPLPPPNTTTNR